MPSTIWRHMPYQLNAANVASRRAKLTTLIQDKLRFEGSGWLRESPSNWPRSSINFALVNVGQIAADEIAPPTSADELLAKFSDFNALLRFLLRLCSWVRLRLKRPSTVPVLSPITAKEFIYAFYACVILSQRQHFALELAKLPTKESHLLRHSPLKGLHVLVDPMGIMQLGGRLHHSSLSYYGRHRAILFSANPIATLVITWAHHRALHGGFRSTYVHVVCRAYIVGAKSQIRAHTHWCVVCTQTQPRPMEQAIAPLPPERVTSLQALTCTESLHGALLQFCGRRGKQAELWSDNATHFNRSFLSKKQALSAIDWDCFVDSMATEGIAWRFIPPAAPHFGGL